MDCSPLLNLEAAVFYHITPEGNTAFLTVRAMWFHTGTDMLLCAYPELPEGRQIMGVNVYKNIFLKLKRCCSYLQILSHNKTIAMQL